MSIAHRSLPDLGMAYAILRIDHDGCGTCMVKWGHRRIRATEAERVHLASKARRRYARQRRAAA